MGLAGVQNTTGQSPSRDYATALAGCAKRLEPAVLSDVPQPRRNQFILRIVSPQIDMAHRPPGIRTDAVKTGLSSVFYGGGTVGGHRYRLQKLNQRGLFLTSFLGAPPLANVAHERVEARSAAHSDRPNRRFHRKFVTIAM